MHWVTVGSLGAALLFAARAEAQHSLCTTNYYSVTGATLREISQSLAAARPSRTKSNHDGYTVWNVTWRFSTLPVANGCRLSTFTTSTTISITLPRWVAPTNASDTVKADWQRYIHVLGQHEYRHAQFGLAAAGEIQRRIKEVGDEPNCDNLRQRVQALCQSIVQTHKQLDDAYDARTQHGATEGVRLRPERSPDQRRNRF